MADAPQTRVEQLLRPIKNNPYSAGLIAAGMVIIALGSFTDAISKISALWAPSSEEIAEYCDLLVPLVAQLDRTKLAFDERWRQPNRALEVQTIKPANEAARSLLLEQAKLVHESLRDDSKDLVEHYDCWLEEYYEQRVINEGSGKPFVFVGPKGCGFPRTAEANFRTRTDELSTKLGSNICE